MSSKCRLSVIVGCSKSKQETDEAVPAYQLYDSDWFDKRWRAANVTCSRALPKDIWILSAEHGIISPSKEITTYDTTLRNMTASERRAFADDLDTTQLGHTCVVYAGTQYVDAIKRATDDDTRVVKPLSGGIGEQKHQLKELLQRT